MQRRFPTISGDPENDDSNIEKALLENAADDNRLNQLGYKQDLSRSLSAISNFAVTFSIISVLTGITTLYNMGLGFGGPVTMVYGWPIVGMMTMIVGLSMAEICSAFPTSGGLYFWSAKLCSNDWAPFASWLTGWYTSHTTYNYYISELFQNLSLSLDKLPLGPDASSSD